ncbi:MAG: SAF domain-containing protein [Ilumatobacteraceae bacterium]
MSGDPSGSVPTRFRPAPRQRVRIAAGAGLVAAGVLGNVVAYSSLDRRVEVVQLVNDVRAGSLVTVADVRIVAVDVDPTVPVTPAADLAAVIDRHAKVHLVAGTLVSPVLLQAEPLLTPGTSVVAVELRPTRVPTGLRERSSIELIVSSGRSGDEPEQIRAVGGGGGGPPPPTEVDGVTGSVSMSVEVDPTVAALVAAADDVRVVLLDPGDDAAYAATALRPEEGA